VKRSLLCALALTVIGLGAVAVAQVVPSPGPPNGIACAFNTSPPTLTTGQAGWAQCDSSGRLITAAGGVNASIGITPTDRTITSASGASQQIMAANASRHSMTIVNTGNANCGVNPTGGTAAIGGAGTITLAALGAYTPRIPTLSAVTVICTAGQPIYADEN